MNLDLYFTTAEVAQITRKLGRVKDPSESAISWCRTRGLVPADGGSTLLWLKDDVLAALHRPRIGARRKPWA